MSAKNDRLQSRLVEAAAAAAAVAVSVCACDAEVHARASDGPKITCGPAGWLHNKRERELAFATNELMRRDELLQALH